jgi:hypothetical protein
MNDEQEHASTPAKPPFYQRRWFQGTGAVVALLTAIWALVGAPKPWNAIGDLFSSELPRVNAEIVFDASDSMHDPFGFGGGKHVSKLDAAANAVSLYGASLSNEGLALRRVGGQCPGPGPRLVDFGANHGDDVGHVAREQRASGTSNLAATVVAAIDDFADSDRFPDPHAPKQLLIFAGTPDECQTGGYRTIRDAIEKTGVRGDFELIGLRFSQADQKQLRQLQAALAGKNFHVQFASNTKDLQEKTDNATARVPGTTGTTGTPTVGGTPSD